jgi:hypothetical protein
MYTGRFEQVPFEQISSAYTTWWDTEAEPLQALVKPVFESDEIGSRVRCNLGRASNAIAIGLQ